MGTKKQESLKKVIFDNTKRTRTISDTGNPDIDLSLMEAMGLKFKKDESRDYFRKTEDEIKLLKEDQLKEGHLVTSREKKSFIIVMLENLTDAQVDDLYKQVEELTGDGGTV